MKGIPVKNKKHLYRDPYSKAIINSDTLAYEKAKRLKREAEEKERRIALQDEEINILKEEVSDLKNLMKELLEKVGD